jgi:enterochelin esterase family protein
MRRRLVGALVAFVLTGAPVQIAQAQAGSLPPLQVSPAARAAAARLKLVTLFDSAYQRQRRIWIHTPVGYDPRRSTPYPLIVAFDGSDYRDSLPLPLILDTLAAKGTIPEFVGVLVDNDNGPVRIADLGNAEKMVTFLGAQLMPFVRANYRVTSDPHRVIVTGSSAGGVGSAFVALRRPDLFGNVLAQSPAVWRGREASNSPPFEWLTSHVAAIPRADVRFFIDVGELETQVVLGGAGPVFRDATRRFRDALKARGYDVTYTEVSGARHAPQDWVTRLPVGITALASPWR